MRKTFFLTGGTGFIGSHIINLLEESGHEVRALRRTGSSPRINLIKQPFWIDGDISGDYNDSLVGVDILIHLASHGVSQGTANDWDRCYQNNVLDSINLYRQAASCDVRRFITIGSCFEYGASGEQFDFIPEDAPLLPTSAYAASKASFTMASIAFAIEREIEMAILRPFHIFGNGESKERFWPSLKNAAQAGLDFNMTAGAQIRDFTPVETAAKQILNYAVSGEFDRHVPAVYNLGTGFPQSLKDFAEYWWDKFEAKGKLLHGSVPYRANEVMRYVPRVNKTIMDFS